MKNWSVLYLPFSIVFLLICSSVNSILASSGTPVIPEKVLPCKLFDLEIPLDDDSLSLEPAIADKEEKIYSFPDLDAEIQAAVDAVVNIIPDDMSDLVPEEAVTPLEDKGKKAIEAARLGGNRIDNFDDLTNIQLPAYRIQKIGNLEAIIVINSLRLESVPETGLPGGRLGVYVGIKIPQKNYDSEGRKKNVTLIFGTEDLGFTKEGGIQAGNIKLANDVFFELGGSGRKAIIELNKGDFYYGGYPSFC